MEMHGNVILKNQIPCLFVRVSLRIFLQGLATNESQHIATSQLRPSHLQLPAVLLEITYQCTATLIKTVKIDIWVLGVFIDGLLCNFKFRSRKLLLQLAPFDVRSGIWKISKTPSLSHPFPGFRWKTSLQLWLHDQVSLAVPLMQYGVLVVYMLTNYQQKGTACVTISQNISIHAQKFW